MKKIQTILVLLFLAFPPGNTAIAQKKKATEAKTEAKSASSKEALITVTTMHVNFDKKDGSAKDWLALEKEYFDKVTAKNELILGSNVLRHYFTADNSEVLIVFAYANWNDIQRAADRNAELIKAAWPDESARKAFFKKKNSYYTNNHSDEIYQEIAGAKHMNAKPDKSMLYYVRKSYFSYPDDGTENDFTSLLGQYLNNVTYKNELVKGYYPHVHAWGANKTEFTEVFVVDALADIEKMFEKDDELFKVAWSDDNKRKTFNDAFNRYFNGMHSDYVYRSVPELTK